MDATHRLVSKVPVTKAFLAEQRVSRARAVPGSHGQSPERIKAQDFRLQTKRDAFVLRSPGKANSRARGRCTMSTSGSRPVGDGWLSAVRNVVHHFVENVFDDGKDNLLSSLSGRDIASRNVR